MGDEGSERFFCEIVGIPNRETVCRIRVCLTLRHTVGTVGVETQFQVDPLTDLWVVFCAPAVSGAVTRELVDGLFNPPEDPVSELDDSFSVNQALSDIYHRAQTVISQNGEAEEIRVIELKDQVLLQITGISGKGQAAQIHSELIKEFENAVVSVHFSAEEIRAADPDFPGEGWFVVLTIE